MYVVVELKVNLSTLQKPSLHRCGSDQRGAHGRRSMHRGFPIGFSRAENDENKQRKTLTAWGLGTRRCRRRSKHVGNATQPVNSTMMQSPPQSPTKKQTTPRDYPPACWSPHSNLHWHGRSRPRDPAHHFPNFAESSLLGSLRGAPKIQNRRRFTMPGRGWSSQPTIRRRLRNPSAWRGSTSMSPFFRPPTQPSSDFPEVLDNPSVLSRTTSF